MAFEQFIKRAQGKRINADEVSIARTGHIRFGSKVRPDIIKPGNYLDCYVDYKSKSIGLKYTDNKTTGYKIGAHKNNESLSITTYSLISRLGVKRGMIVKPRFEGDLIILDLSDHG